MKMQHVKDAALLFVTGWAALVTGRAVALMLFYVWPAPMQSDTAGAVIVCASVFLAGVAAGAVLMTHLKWAARFQVLILVPFCLAATAIVAHALRSSMPMSFLSELGWATWAQLELLALAVGIVAGAAVRRFFGAAVSLPNKTIEPTR